MTENPNPSVRSRQVANQLRTLREAAGMTGAEVAKLLGMSASKVSRIETGHRMLSVDVVATLLGLYRVPERQRDQILDQVRKSAERGWWESQGLGLPELWKALIDFESRATRIQNYEAVVVPGLLQTAEYTGAIINGINRAMTESELTNLVASRMARQAVLRRSDLQVLALIDEGALRLPIAERGVMRRQLRHLADSAERPNVTLRVAPLQAGPHVGIRGSFAVMDFAEEPSLVFFENQHIGMFLDEKEDIAAYRVALSKYPERGTGAGGLRGVDLRHNRRNRIRGGGTMSALDLSNARWRKSSRSTDTANCVEIAFLACDWRKSSRSSDQANCVEVAFAGPAVGVRDSKNAAGPVLAFPAHTWSAIGESPVPAAELPTQADEFPSQATS